MSVIQTIVSDFVLLWAVIDPIGTVPVFISATSRLSREEQARIALRAAAIATGILLFFIIAGEAILAAMGVPVLAFQIAGGIVLFLFALTMIFGESKPESEMEELAKSRASQPATPPPRAAEPAPQAAPAHAGPELDLDAMVSGVDSATPYVGSAEDAAADAAVAADRARARARPQCARQSGRRGRGGAACRGGCPGASRDVALDGAFGRAHARRKGRRCCRGHPGRGARIPVGPEGTSGDR